MYKKKKTYELEVHFGLLVLVIIMLCLNFVSNYVIYNARNILNDECSSELSKTSLSISRYLQNNKILTLSDEAKQEFKFKYKLDNILLIPSEIKQLHAQNNSQKVVQLLNENDIKANPQILKNILTSDYYLLSHGENEEYHFMVPVTIRKQTQTLIVTKKFHELAYLDSASETLSLISIIALLAITVIYILLYRFILSPFKMLKENATSAGRNIPQKDYEVDSVVAEYQTIIKELKEKELELIELHKEATHRADTYEQFNDYLLDSMQAGIITINQSGELLTLNRAVEQLFGIDAVLFVGSNYKEIDFIPKSLQGKIELSLMDMKYIPYEEYKLPTVHKHVGITISPICNNDTNQIGASILINDITNIKDLQNELEKNRQMSALGEMSAGLAHQLRNSLGAMVGFNSLVKKRLKKLEIDTTMVDNIEAELKESENLIKRFLNFTKPFDFAPSNENIKLFMEKIVETLSVRKDFENITFELKNNLASPLNLFIDSLLLKQAITNILENCVKAYTHKTGKIEINLSVVEDTICQIIIKDFGCGIEQKNIDKIFTPFYSTDPSGTGLGLPLAQKIIALHEGNLSIESIVDQGTTFILSLPLHKFESFSNS